MEIGGAAKIGCRQIEPFDIPAIVECLTKGFPDRSQAYWMQALNRLAHRDLPPDCPRFGYMLVLESRCVGVLLTIFSMTDDAERPTLRCNVSSWYIEPEARSYATLLVSCAFKNRSATFVNISPAPHTLPILKAQGYRCYSSGQFFAAPILSRSCAGTRIIQIERFRGGDCLGIDSGMRQMLTEHSERGGFSLVAATERGAASPFTFVRRRTTQGGLPAVLLTYCRDRTDFVRYAGNLGRFFLRRGFLIVILDANGPIPGLRGRFFANKAPKYFRGLQEPRLGDLTATELTLFGS